MKKRDVAIGFVAVVLVLLLVGLVLGGILWGRTPFEYGPGMMGGFRQPFGTHMFVGGILAVLLGVLILGVLAMLVSRLVSNEKTAARKDETPLEILRRRYANGEVDREEFERIKEALVS